MSKVVIEINPDIEQAIVAAMENIENLRDLITNKHVAIKPNETWASAKDLTACTQADSLRAVIKSIKKYNPKKITITGGAGAAETEDIFRLLGFDKIIKEEEVDFFDHNRPPFQEVELKYGPQKKVVVNSKVFEYETLVSLAQLKVHKYATVTLSMKNIAMSYPAADYYGHPRNKKLHPHNFFKDMQGFITGMCQKFPIDLGIIVGHPAMTVTGPIGGWTFEADLVLVSTDFVAVDSIGAKILGEDKVGHITQAENLGLGTSDIEKIQILGVPLVRAIEHFRLKEDSAK